MVEGKTIAVTAGMILTLALAISGTYFFSQDDDAYYCQSKDMVMVCDKLSSGIGTRCYYEDTYKVCSEGWVKLETGQTFVDEKDADIIIYNYQSDGVKWLCSPEGCSKLNLG